MALLTRRSASDEGESPEGRELNRRLDEIERKRYADELAKLRRRVAKARAEIAKLDQRVTGGPCVFCGLSMSRESWHGSPSRVICPECIEDHWTHDDGEHRSLVIHMLAEGVNPVGVRTYNVGDEAQREVQRTGFKWWSETPGAKPGGWRRFAYLDVPRLRERLAEPTTETPSRYSAGDPCEKCGCAYLWTKFSASTMVHIPMRVNDDDPVFRALNDDEVPVVPDSCAGCASYESLLDIVRQIVGIADPTAYEENSHQYPARGGPSRGVVAAGSRLKQIDVPAHLGVTWYVNRPTKMRDRASTLAPWAYLDLPTIRAKALLLFPFESQWTNKQTFAALVARHGNPLGRPAVVPHTKDE